MAALGVDHGGELFQPTKAYKNKCKKFRKAAEKGGVNTAAALADHLDSGEVLGKVCQTELAGDRANLQWLE